VNANSCIHTIKWLPLPILNDAVRCQFSILELFKSCLFRLLSPNFVVGVADTPQILDLVGMFQAERMKQKYTVCLDPICKAVDP
jgi:hypothetical protein